MKIGVWDYLAEYEAERESILDAVETVFRSGVLILGKSVRSFEEEFAAYCGARHGVGVDNGTNALTLALQALDVGPGDEVITVSNTAAPTVVAIDATGARARFVDVDAGTYLMDVSQLEAAITPRTRCVVPVHLYGQCVDMTALREVTDRRGIFVVEDCAQSHGAQQDGLRAGSIGDAAAFSFYPTKVLGAYGDGGMVLTRSDETERRLRRIRYYGMGDRYYVEATPAHNSRLDEVQAEILRRKLCRLDGYIARRSELAARYRQQLAGTPLVLPEAASGNSHIYYVYVVRHPCRDAILDMMAARDVHLNVSYRWPVHLMTGFAGLGYKAGDLPVTEALAGEIFSLPMYPSLTDYQQDRVCEALTECVEALPA